MADGMNLKLNISGANKVQRELKQTGKAAGTMGKGMKGATGSAAGLGAMIGPQGLQFNCPRNSIKLASGRGRWATPRPRISRRSPGLSSLLASRHPRRARL
mgnify:CR=1 FL=1